MNNVAILAGCEYYEDQALKNLIGVNHDIQLMHEALIKYCGCEEGTVFEITKNNKNQKELSGVEIVSVKFPHTLPESRGNEKMQ